MKFDVEFSDGHVETVEVESSPSRWLSDTTIAEVAAVGQYPGTARVVRVREYEEVVEVRVTRTTLDYIQRHYDTTGAMGDDQLGHVYEDGWTRGIEFMVQQLGLPIRIRH